MIHYTKENGCYYEHETNGKHYELNELMTYKGNTTSDIVAIFDNDNLELVGWFPGANIFGIDEIDEAVKEIVEEYEAKQKAKQKAKAEVLAEYKFSNAGIKAFLDDASTDFFAEMEKDWDDQHLENYDIVISCGKRKISVPLGAEEWGGIENWLTDAVENWEA